MGIFSRLFGSEKVVDSGLSALDKVWYTDEEKADTNLMKAKLKTEYLGLFQPYKLAQRVMMITVCLAFVGLHVVMVIAWLIALLFASSEMYDFVSGEIAKVMALHADALFIPFVVIVGFYFGTGEIDISRWLTIGKKK